METNETILMREIVAIDERRKLGRVKDLRVDCDTLAVCHYIVDNTVNDTALVLPFDKSLAVGDTFMTIQNSGDFLPTFGGEAKRILEDGYRLIGVDVFSQNGNRLGTLQSYEYDTTYGAVTAIILDSQVVFAASTFVFFAPEFVFVDDGEATAYEVRHGIKPVGEKKSEIKKPPTSAPRDSKPAAPLAAPTGSAVFVDPQAYAAEANGENDVLKEFLIGATLSEDVESKDGLFKVAKGTVITKELAEEAEIYDALLLLTMAVES